MTVFSYDELRQAKKIKEQVNKNLAKKETNTVAVKSNKNVVSSFIDGAKGKVVDTKIQLVKQFANNPIGTYGQAVIDNVNPLKQNAFVKLYDIGSEAYNGLIKGNANQKAEYLGGVAGHTAESVLFSGAVRLPAKVKVPTIQSGTGLLKNFLVEEHGSFGLPGFVGEAAGNGQKLLSPGKTPKTGTQPGPTIDTKTGYEVGTIYVDPRGNGMISPKGGGFTSGGYRGLDTQTTYPNGSAYQRNNPNGHASNPGANHGHGHLPVAGPGRGGTGPSIDVNGNIVPYNSPAAHWTTNP